jgi:ABC-2 type transport system permease protein
MITAFRAMIRKDLRLFFVYRRALIMSFAAPIAIASFFGYALGGSGSGQTETSKIAVLAIDDDGSAVSREIIRGLTAEKALDVKPSTEEPAREAVRKGSATVAVSIPKGFQDRAGQALFGGGTKPDIPVLYDPSHGAERAMVQGILTGDVMQAVSKELFTGATGRGFLQQSITQVERGQGLPPDDQKALTNMLRSVEQWYGSPSVQAGAASGLTVPFATREEAVTSRRGIRYNGYAHAFAGMAVQFILFLGIDFGISLLLQRQRGLWRRFRAAPLSRATLLGSRAASGALIAFAVLLVNFLFARLAFGVRVEGSLAGFLAVAAAFGLMTACFGLLIAALGKTPDATRGLAIFATLLLVMFGGAWIPTFIFPQWLQNITVVMPTRWAIDGLEAMTWRGLGFQAALAPVAVQLAFAALFGVLAVMRFKWEES